MRNSLAVNLCSWVYNDD